MNILLVEDSEDDVFMLQRAFKKAGISDPMQIASDGAHALDYVKGQGKFADRTANPAPELVLLDIQLPYFTGLEVLAGIRGSGLMRRIPVIMLTSSSQDDDMRRAYELGANAYLVKPSNLEQLVTMAGAIKSFWLEHNRSVLPKK